MTNRKSKTKFKAICQCGHDHVNVTGDNGKNHDEERYELLDECCYCDCEKFKRLGK